MFPALGLIPADGPAVRAGPSIDAEGPFHTEVERVFEPAVLFSLQPDAEDLALEAVSDLIARGARLGLDAALPLPLAGRVEPVDLRATLARHGRFKHLDELALIQAATRAGEAAYRAVEPLLVEGTREIDLFAAYQAAAISAAGQEIGELGNDFRGGAMGGGPRQVPLKTGELIPIDTGVSLFGYHSDLCRTYPIGGDWSPLQLRAARRVTAAHDLALSMIGPGLSCRRVYDEVHRFLDGFEGLRFPTHLGHGIGLMPVETPRINPHWDDQFEIGDVFTLEPGLYGEALRGGLRIENDYGLAEDGVRALSDSTAVLPGQGPGQGDSPPVCLDRHAGDLVHGRRERRICLWRRGCGHLATERCGCFAGDGEWYTISPGRAARRAGRQGEPGAMKALMTCGAGELRRIDLPTEPTGPRGPGHARLRLREGICGTGLRARRSREIAAIGVCAPVVCGHEASRAVIAIGAGAQTVARGRSRDMVAGVAAADRTGAMKGQSECA